MLEVKQHNVMVRVLKYEQRGLVLNLPITLKALIVGDPGPANLCQHGLHHRVVGEGVRELCMQP